MLPHVCWSPCLIIKVFGLIGSCFRLGYGIAVIVTGVKPVISKMFTCPISAVLTTRPTIGANRSRGGVRGSPLLSKGQSLKASCAALHVICSRPYALSRQVAHLCRDIHGIPWSGRGEPSSDTAASHSPYGTLTHSR